MEGKRNNQILNLVMNHSLDLICTIDAEGRFIQVSAAFYGLFGSTCPELEGQDAKKILRFDELTWQAAKGNRVGASPIIFENSYLQKSKQAVWVRWSAVWAEEEKLLFCVGRVITEPQPAHTNQSPCEELQRVMIEYGSDMLALLDEKGNYLHVAGESVKELGYLPEQLVGKNAFEFIHPQDVSQAQEALGLVQQTQQSITIPEMRFKSGAGPWRWVEVTVSNQLENPAIRAIFISSRDITTRKEAQLQVEESAQRFRSLFENNPDMVLYQNETGTILDANPAFISFINQSKEAVVNRLLFDFLPAEAIAIFQEKLQEAFAGSKVRFKVDVHFKALGLKVLSVVKVPLIVAGKVVGVHAVIRDITTSLQAHRVIEQQAKRLNTILESITDAFCTFDKNWNLTYSNPECDRILKIDWEKEGEKKIWDLFPEEKSRTFYQQCQQAIVTGKAVHFKAYAERLARWLEVKAYPSPEGLTVYFQDITERLAAKRELEKLSLVARKTTNSVIITDAQGLTEWVNEGFTHLTGYGLADMVGKKPGTVLQGPDTQPATIQRVREKLQTGEPFIDEILNYKKSGEKFWLRKEITPIRNNAGEITQFIAIQNDITASKKAEEELRKMSQDLFKQNRDLQQFTYIISHNLRAPIANALGFARILGSVPKDAAEFDTSLSYLQQSLTRLDEVLKDINHILSVRDKKNIFEESISIREVCQQAVGDLRESLRHCQAQVQVQIPSELLVHTNRAYLYSIFHNLLTNAIKYRSPERTLQITIASSEAASEGPVLSFSDNGMGFDRKKAGDNVFKMYKRFHPNIEGKGLGLFLVKTHVEAMDGQIAVNSQVGVGTNFVIHLKESRHENVYH